MSEMIIHFERTGMDAPTPKKEFFTWLKQAKNETDEQFTERRRIEHDRYLKQHREYVKKRRLEDKEWADKDRKRLNAYRLSNPGKWCEYKTGARRRGIEWSFPADKNIFFMLLEDKCHYCPKAPARGVDRYDNKLGYSPSNCVPCCTNCNTRKQTFDAGTFVAKLAKERAISDS